jgi:hypothetical protein
MAGTLFANVRIIDGSGTEPFTQPDESRSPLDHIIPCPENSDDGHLGSLQLSLLTGATQPPQDHPRALSSSLKLSP